MLKPTTVSPAPIVTGIDLGDRLSHVCVLDADGEVVSRFTLASTREAFSARFAPRIRGRVVMEAGTHSPWVSRLLEGMGHETVVANPRRMPANPVKTDSHDAEFLARWGRADVRLLYPIRHRDARKQADLSTVRARDVAVRARTKLINHVRGTAKSFGVRLPSCKADVFPERALEHLPPEIVAALTPLLAPIEGLTRTIGVYDLTIESLAKEVYPETALLRQVPRVGPVTALCFVLVVGDWRRIPRSRSVGAYLGLTPRVSQSGAIDPQLRISKAGDALLRRLLVQCAQLMVRPTAPDSALRRLGLHLAAVGGRAGRKRAVVAVARRLAVLLHSLWKTGEVYEPLRGAPSRP